MVQPRPEKINLIISGTIVDSISDNTYDLRNPANSEIIAQVPLGTREDVKAAIDAAKESFGKWATLKPIDRAKLLLKAAESISNQKTELARLVTIENGKPLHEARAEIDWVINSIVGDSMGNSRLFGDFSQSIPRQFAYRRIEPVGVCGILLPFNNPAGQWSLQVPVALVAGNTLVIKPASTTPLAEFRLTKELTKVGIPPGVVNFVTGPGGVIGDEIVKSTDTNMISLTGEYVTGVKIMQSTAPQMKRLSLNLGGSDPLVVCDDADIAAAVEYGVQNRFRNAGQGCMCTKRIFVFERAYHTFLKSYLEKVKQIRVGNGMDGGVTMGPLHTAAGRETIRLQVEDALDKGAKLELGGKNLETKPHDKGFFYLPTVLTKADFDSSLAIEETFGPVIPIWKVRDISEAIERCNDSPFGLSGTIFTKDIGRANRFLEEYVSAFGRVNASSNTDFEGFGRNYVKRSGFGTEGIEAYIRRRPAVINAA